MFCRRRSGPCACSPSPQVRGRSLVGRLPPSRWTPRGLTAGSLRRSSPCLRSRSPPPVALRPANGGTAERPAAVQRRYGGRALRFTVQVGGSGIGGTSRFPR
ncbi:hypothetical protein GA0115261_115674 [Streptomyces sp. OspMP-M43]|nr:hypothetical protein GA0115261_115674 [Streptomyces sp. OspMP-M43]